MLTKSDIEKGPFRVANKVQTLKQIDEEIEANHTNSDEDSLQVEPIIDELEGDDLDSSQRALIPKTAETP